MPISYYHLLLLLLITITNLNNAYANDRPSFSSQRYIDESYQQAAQRNFAKKLDFATTEIDYLTAYNVAAALETIDFSTLVDWQDKESLNHAFLSARDSRFLAWDYNGNNYSRRLPWLYPQDGCYVRAELLKEKLTEYGYPAIKKLFVFGDLLAKTNNSPAGQVAWWFHVVVVTRIQQQVYVFDPAIEPKNILTLAEWIAQLGDNSDDLKFALCDANTFSPVNHCYQPYKMPPLIMNFATGLYLNLEWHNLNKLNRATDDELQDNPPWRQQFHAWGVNNRQGIVGDIYINNNWQSKTVEFFKLLNVDSKGKYWLFPANQNSNYYWQYLGTQLAIPYLQPLKVFNPTTRQGRVGDIYIHNNPETAQTEYFLLSRLAWDGRYQQLPNDQSDNYSWKFLGSNYPLDFAKQPITWQLDNMTNAKIGSIFQAINPDNQSLEFFRLSNVDENGDYDELPLNQMDNEFWEYLH